MPLTFKQMNRNFIPKTGSEEKAIETSIQIHWDSAGSEAIGIIKQDQFNYKGIEIHYTITAESNNVSTISFNSEGKLKDCNIILEFEDGTNQKRSTSEIDSVLIEYSSSIKLTQIKIN